MKILIWQIRDKKNITLKRLEELTGIGKTTLNDIENEKISPTLQQLELIAEALNVRITELFDSKFK